MFVTNLNIRFSHCKARKARCYIPGYEHPQIVKIIAVSSDSLHYLVEFQDDLRVIHDKEFCW